MTAASIDLDSLYQQPSEIIKKAVHDHLVDLHVDYLKVATFCCISTISAGGLTVSPRGGPPGFVRALDAHHIAFADWPGNNKLETLRNLGHDNRLAMVFIFPGLEIFLRINGRAQVSVDPELLSSLIEKGQKPKTATVMRVECVHFHCGRAVNRAQLWNESSKLEISALPTIGQIIATLAKGGEAPIDLIDADVKRIDDDYYEAVRNKLHAERQTLPSIGEIMEAAVQRQSGASHDPK